MFRRIDPSTHYHVEQDRDFLRAVLEDRPPMTTGEDGRKVVEIVAAIYRSAKQRRARAPSAGRCRVIVVSHP